MYPSFSPTTIQPLIVGQRAFGIAIVCLLVVGCGRRISPETTRANDQSKEIKVVPAKPTLQIHLDGARSETGNFACALFANSDDFANRTNPVASASLPVQQTTWTLSDLAAGRYVAAIFHDENLNGKLDRHALGYPTEPYGFSNNARGRFGPPRFEDATFDFSNESMELKILLK